MPKSSQPVSVPRKSKYTFRVGRSSAGLGLFTEEKIKRGDFVIEYYGPILTEEETYRKKGKYLMGCGRKVIDGSQRYNTARYINHSCRPNCEAVNMRGKVYIYAKRNIKPDEELSYNYGKEYFNDFIQPQGCKCAHCAKKSETK